MQVLQLGFDCSSYALFDQSLTFVNAGRLPAAVAAHLTPQGGWVEFHPSSHPLSDPGEPTTALAIPTLRPLAWVRLTTAAETELLRPRDADSDSDSETLPQRHHFEGPWWQDLEEPGLRERWGSPRCMTQSFCVLTDSPIPSLQATTPCGLTLLFQANTTPALPPPPPFVGLAPRPQRHPLVPNPPRPPSPPMPRSHMAPLWRYSCSCLHRFLSVCLHLLPCRCLQGRSCS